MAIDPRWTLARAPRWIITLLTKEDEPVAEIPGVRGGEVKIAALSRLGGSATLELSRRSLEIDPFTHRVQISYDPGIRGIEPEPFGTYLFSSPKTTNAYVRQGSYGLLTKMVIIDEDAFSESYSLPAGAPIIPAVEDIILSTGETRIAVTPSDATLTTDFAMQAGESKLTIINELLDAAGYASLWCDRSGQYRIEPYIDPGSRPEAYVFEAGDTSLHKTNWIREQNLVGVPNRVIVVAGGSDEEEPIVASLDIDDIDPTSPFSIANRGRVISRKEEVSDVSSQAEADQLARRYLLGGMSPVGTIEAVHAILPLEPNDLIRFRSGETDVRATVREMTFSINFASQCNAIWREVPSG